MANSVTSRREGVIVYDTGTLSMLYKKHREVGTRLYFSMSYLFSQRKFQQKSFLV